MMDRLQFRTLFLMIGVLACLLIQAPSRVSAQGGTVVQGCETGTLNCHRINVDTNGSIIVSNNSSYVAAYSSGITAITSGTTTSVTTTPTLVQAMLITNRVNSSITLNLMDNSGNYILPTNFVMPALSSVSMNFSSGLVYSGVQVSASASSALTINVGGRQ